jgi:hypothetical protein
MLANAFKSGEVVAVLPHGTSPTGDPLEIAAITRAGSVFVELSDGRRYATRGGTGFNTNGYIIAATDEHRATFNGRRQVLPVLPAPRHWSAIPIVDDPWD